METEADQGPLKLSRSGAVLVLELDRPARRNAVNAALADAIDKALTDAEDDPGVRVVVVTGGGTFFSAGTDLTGAAAPRRTEAVSTASCAGGGPCR